jgi:hypothetical protein
LVVEVDDGPVDPGQGGDDKAHPREEFPEVMLDLGNHSPRPVPGRGPILEASIPHQRGVAGSAPGPGEQVLDHPLQHLIGREPDGVRHTPALEGLVQRWEGKGRVGADDDGLPPGLGSLNEREEDLLPPVRTVDVARPERGGQAVAILIEGEERMVADRLEVAIVGRLLLRAVDRALGAVDLQDQPPRERAGCLVLHQVRIEARESLIVPLLREDFRFEPVQGGGERNARPPPLTRGQHPKGGILGQPLRVVGILVAGQAAIDRLAKEIRQGELVVVSGARISEVSFDQRAQAEALIQLAGQQQPGVGGHRGAPKLDAKLGIECEANRARCRVTHWVVPSVPARSPREPRFMRALSDYRPVHSSFKSKMRA